MIVSHSRRFVFVKTLKVGGTSLEMALSRLCGPGDIIGPLDADEEPLRREYAGLAAQNHRHAPRGLTGALRGLTGKPPPLRFREHMPAWQIRREIGDETWRSYFTFTVVRNPFDRCVSRYFHCLRENERLGRFEQWSPASFDQFLRYNPEMITENWRTYTVQDKPIVNFCVRYEHLEADLAEVSRRLGLASNVHDEMRAFRLKGESRPRNAHYREVVGPRQRALIETLCAEEIRLFGYGFDAPAPARALEPA